MSITALTTFIFLAVCLIAVLNCATFAELAIFPGMPVALAVCNPLLKNGSIVIAVVNGADIVVSNGCANVSIVWAAMAGTIASPIFFPLAYGLISVSSSSITTPANVDPIIDANPPSDVNTSSLIELTIPSFKRRSRVARTSSPVAFIVSKFFLPCSSSPITDLPIVFPRPTAAPPANCVVSSG